LLDLERPAQRLGQRENLRRIAGARRSQDPSTSTLLAVRVVGGRTQGQRPRQCPSRHAPSPFVIGTKRTHEPTCGDRGRRRKRRRRLDHAASHKKANSSQVTVCYSASNAAAQCGTSAQIFRFRANVSAVSTTRNSITFTPMPLRSSSLGSAAN